MDLELTEDQQLFRETTARFLEAEWPLGQVRSYFGKPVGHDDRYLKHAAALGWFAMLVPEEHGGGSISGGGLLDAAIVAEERGALLQPGPFVDVNAVVAGLVRDGSAAQQGALLPAIAAGELSPAWVPGDRNGELPIGGGVAATSEGSDFLLDGEAGLVANATTADVLLVSARADRGLRQFLVPSDAEGLFITPLDGLDLTQRFARVRFDGVLVGASHVVGEPGRDAAATTEVQLQVAIVLLLAEVIGSIDRLFELTRAYALDRTAFGRPIGSFQALKHLLADLSMAVEASKAYAVAAAHAVQEGQLHAGELCSMAKVFVGGRSTDVAQGCLQVFAGIGFTWEHDLHLYLRRLASANAQYGSAAHHLERVWAAHDR